MLKKFFKRFDYKNFIMLTVAGIVNAIGVALFLSPAGLIDSGLSGTSILLDKVTPSFLTLSLFLIVLNVPFYVFAHKKIGLNFVVYSLYSILVYSLVAFLIQSVIPFDFSNGSPITHDDKLLSAIFGGLISGLGSGLVIRYGGAIDGVEVVAVLFAKKIGLTIGSFVMIYNVILYVISALVLPDGWQIPLYSIIAYYVGLKMVDSVVDGIDKGKAVFIITETPDAITKSISEQLKRTVTIIDGHGYYSNKPKKILYVVINRFELPRLKNIVKSADSQAFVAVQEVTETLGTKIKYKVNYDNAHVGKDK